MRAFRKKFSVLAMATALVPTIIELFKKLEYTR